MKRKLLRLLAWLAAPFYLPAAWLKAYRLGKKKRTLIDQYDSERAYKFVIRVIKFIKVLKNITLDIQDINKWKYTPGLIVANHQSNADGMIILLALLTDKKFPLESAFIAKFELEKDRIIAPFLKTIKTYFIDRGNIRQIVEVFDAAKKEITNNKTNLIVFPEGKRSNSAIMNDFIPGAFKLAIQTYAPVKPVAIIDSYRIFQKGEKKGNHVKVVFCDEIPADRVMMMDTIGLAKYVHDLIKTKVDKFSTKFEDDKKSESKNEMHKIIQNNKKADDDKVNNKPI